MEKQLKDIIGTLSLLQNMYDQVRVVDPIKKIVILDKEEYISNSITSCYDIWKLSKFCSNCISMRAYNENNTFVKVEYNQESLYILIASPVQIGAKKYVIEMMKDITETGVVEGFSVKTTEEMQAIIYDMHDKIIKDDLTGTFNRRYLNERLPIELLRSLTEEQPLSMIMTDIDFFKNANDTYGHIVGDGILSQFSALLKENLREEMDWVVRYGGEEFIIVLQNMDIEGAYNLAEEIRSQVEKKVFLCEGHEIRITSSFGVNTIKENGFTVNINELIDIVDNKLFTAKRTGRNKCCV